jgi:hypothetical protein
MRRHDFLRRAAALWCGRRDGTGPPPPASRALRVSCGNGLRPPVTPETSGGPPGQHSGQARGAARSAAAPSRAARPSRWPALHPPPERRDTGTRQQPPDTSVHLFDYVNRQKNYKADRRSAAKLSLNQSRGAPHRHHDPAGYPHLPATQPPPAAARRRHAHPDRDRRTARRVHRHHQDLAPRRSPHRTPLQRQRPVPLPPARPQPPSPRTRTQAQPATPHHTRSHLTRPAKCQTPPVPSEQDDTKTPRIDPKRCSMQPEVSFSASEHR